MLLYHGLFVPAKQIIWLDLFLKLRITWNISSYLFIFQLSIWVLQVQMWISWWCTTLNFDGTSTCFNCFRCNVSSGFWESSDFHLWSCKHFSLSLFANTFLTKWFPFEEKPFLSVVFFFFYVTYYFSWCRRKVSFFEYFFHNSPPMFV